jgi:hypothetical protein
MDLIFSINLLMKMTMMIYLYYLNEIIIEITHQEQFYIVFNATNIYVVIALIIIMKYFKEEDIKQLSKEYPINIIAKSKDMKRIF